MPTLRLTLFDKSFEILDRIDIAVTGEEKHGAGEATKAAKQHFWSNHFASDLDPLLASRANLLQKLDELLARVEKLREEGDRDDAPLMNWDLTEFRGAVQESRMMDDALLPQKYREELERRFGSKLNNKGDKIR